MKDSFQLFKEDFERTKQVTLDNGQDLVIVPLPWDYLTEPGLPTKIREYFLTQNYYYFTHRDCAYVILERAQEAKL